MENATLDDLVVASGLLRCFEAAMGGVGGSFDAQEQFALRLCNAVARLWAQRTLQEMTSRYGDEILVDGLRYRRHTSGKVAYHTLSGSIEVTRHTYRQIGVHNGPTVVPLELEAGILENATPALVQSVVQGFATTTLRDYEREMQVALREVPSRSTLERIAKRVSDRLHADLPMIEPVVRAVELVPEKTRSLSVGLDRSTIPMAEARGCAPPTSREPPYIRRPPDPITVAFRMGYVATLALHDERGETLKTIKIAATPSEGPDEMLERLGAEVMHVLRQRPGLPVVVVQDGAPELWGLADELLENLGIRPALKLIDRFHLAERIAATCEALERNTRKRQRLNRRWQGRVDSSDRGIRSICRHLYRSLYGESRTEDDGWPTFRPAVHGQNWNIAHANLTYFVNHAPKMRYATARRRGFPVGSGPTEAACKSVFAARFKRSGQRWNERGAAACALARTLYLNERLHMSIGLLIQSSQTNLSIAN